VPFGTVVFPQLLLKVRVVRSLLRVSRYLSVALLVFIFIIQFSRYIRLPSEAAFVPVLLKTRFKHSIS
jgi:hypothetical protein